MTRVFSSGQHLYFYYEVYDPAKGVAGTCSRCGRGQRTPDSIRFLSVKKAVRLLSNVSFFKGDVKAYETSLAEVQEISVPNRQAAVFQLDVPLSS